MAMYAAQEGERYPPGFLRVAQGKDRESYGMLKSEDPKGKNVTEIFRWKLEEDKIEGVKELLKQLFSETHGIGLWTIDQAMYKLNSLGLVAENVPNDVDNYLQR